MVQLTGIFTVNVIIDNYTEVKKTINNYSECIIIHNSNVVNTVNGIFVEKSFIESHKDFFKKIRSI